MKFEIAPETLDAQVPILLLQPLVDNAVKHGISRLVANGEIRISSYRHNGDLKLEVRDNGPGLTNADNLFVPFYTTKPGGTGIGLVLAQQIAQAHRGSVQLANRTDGQAGCRAELRLPLL